LGRLRVGGRRSVEDAIRIDLDEIATLR